MFASLFRTKPEKVEADLLYEARRLLIEHDAHAEHHKALADMYRARITRIDPPRDELRTTPQMANSIGNAFANAFANAQNAMNNAFPTSMQGRGAL